jgi:putative transposase
MVNQYQQHLSVKCLCQWIELPLSSFHYKPLEGKSGAKPSTYTKMQNGTVVVNEEVIDSIKKLLSEEFVCYGYKKVAASLKQLNYLINDKKVYRLMDQSNLLLGKVIKTTGKRQFVKHRKITAACPMDYLCLDIKYLWVHGEQRWYYLLSVIDVYSRKVIAWILQRSIRQIDVINIFRKINQNHPIKGVNIRNDNGSQFLANSVKKYLSSEEAKQEFTHIATPQENSYIEAYHSILQTEVVERFEISSYYEAKLIMTNYVHFYNHKRLHGSLKMQTPQSVWNNWHEQNKIPTKGEWMSLITEMSPLLKNIKKNNSNNQKCQTFDKI